MRKMLVLTFTILIILAFFTPLNSEDADADMFRGDLNRSGVYESSVPENNTLLWSFDSGIYMIQSSPVVVDNRVYFGSDNGMVYCLDALDGDEEWNFPTDGAVKSTPAVVDGVVYVGSTDRNMYALDADNGNKLWNYSFASYSAQIWSSPAVSNNMIFFGTDDNNFYALNITDAQSPELEWTFTTGGLVQSSPAVDWPNVYFGSVDGKVYCVYANNGTQKWAFEPGDSFEFYSSPVLANQKLFIGSGRYNIGGVFYCLDAQTGQESWRFLPPGDGRFSEIYSSAAVHGGTVFVHAWHKISGSDQLGTLYALPEQDPNSDGNITGDEIVWSFRTWDNEGGSSPAVADGKVLVGSTNNRLYCVDEFTGVEIWNITTGGMIVASPFIANGIVYITAEDGNVYAVEGDVPVALGIEIIPEFSSLKSNRVMGISFVVTYKGSPIEGAFLNFNVDIGNLSQNGASTFGDGSQRIKFTAPDVLENTTVTISATVTKFGYTSGNSTATFNIEPSTAYGQVKTSSMFSLSKYWLYLVAMIALIIVNIVIVILGRRRKKVDIDEKVGE
jgi:outer membrane protein assembly factor BamB